MTPYKKQFSFNIDNINHLKEKLIKYFKAYDFLYEEKEKNQITFFKKFSFFAGRKMNPLNWESQVVITIHNDNIILEYCNEGNAQITPHAFDDFFSEFFKNLELSINKNINMERQNYMAIKKARQKIAYHFLLLICGIFISVLLGIYLKKYFDFYFLGYLSVIGGAYLSLKLMNNYWINKTS